MDKQPLNQDFTQQEVSIVDLNMAEALISIHDGVAPKVISTYTGLGIFKKEHNLKDKDLIRVEKINDKGFTVTIKSLSSSYDWETKEIEIETDILNVIPSLGVKAVRTSLSFREFQDASTHKANIDEWLLSFDEWWENCTIENKNAFMAMAKLKLKEGVGCE